MFSLILRVLGVGEVVLGDGDWCLGPNPNPPIPNPQSPIPNPQSPIPILQNKFLKNLISIQIQKYFETYFNNFLLGLKFNDKYY